MTDLPSQRDQWNNSYDKRQNFMFFPNEELIRFVARNFRQQTGLTEYRNARDLPSDLRSLDLGCGIGRHVHYLSDAGFDSYGIDLSDSAIQFAREWALDRGMQDIDDHIVLGDSSTLPWDDDFFDCIVSHGVLDSMSFDTAVETLREIERTLKSDGLAYVDLISGDDSAHHREFSGEEVGTNDHEYGTIQGYYNYEKILRLLDAAALTAREMTLVRRESLLDRSYGGRYHLALAART